MIAPAADYPFAYWAFISHSSHDKRVARWLRDELAKARAPKQGAFGIRDKPAKFAPVFLDERDIELGKLDERLSRALDQSRHLIVICSPFATRSEYVELEIAHFVSRGRADDIICVIASGSANATDGGKPELEAFPRPLRYRLNSNTSVSDEPIPAKSRSLAASLGTETPAEQATVLEMVCARLSGLTREGYRAFLERRRLKSRALAATAAAAIAGATYLYWDANYAEHREYFRDFIRVNGDWLGIGKLSEREASQRDHYLFVRKGRNTGQDLDVFFRNGAGSCAADGIVSILGKTLVRECNELRACSAHIEHTKEGVKKEQLNDQYGHEIETLTYDIPSVGNFFEGGFGCSRTRSLIRQVSIERYENPPFKGQDKRIVYLAGRDQPRPAPDGHVAKSIEYGESRLPVRETYQTAEGQPAPLADGTVSREWIRDAQGEVRSERRRAVDGTVLEQMEFERDDLGRIHRKHLRFGDSKPRVDFVAKVASYEYAYDSHGLPKEVRYFGPDGKRTYANDGSSGYQSSFDPNGFERSRTFVDTEGKETLARNGCVRIDYGRDTWGNPVTTRCFGKSDESRVFLSVKQEKHELEVGPSSEDESGGCHSFRREYNGKGYEREASCWGQANSPSLSLVGIHRATYDYDTVGNRVRTRIFDEHGKPSYVKSYSSYAIWETQYDQDGIRPILQTFRDHLGEILPKCGRNTFTYDSDGHETGGICLDAQGLSLGGMEQTFDVRARVASKQAFGNTALEWLHDGGFAGWENIRNARGQITEQRYLDANKAPTVPKSGISAVSVGYDANGYAEMTTWLGLDHKPTIGDDGTAGYRAQRDDRGNVTEWAWFGPDGKPPGVNWENGVAGWHSEFNEKNDEVRRCYFGPDNQNPVLAKQGIHCVWNTEIDALGNVLEVRFLGMDEKQFVLDKQGVGGYRRKYDEFRHLIEETPLGLDGKRDPVRLVYRFEYDGRGNRISQCGSDGAGHLAENSGEVACIKWDYDNRDRKRSEAYFGVDGQPKRNTIGIHKVSYGFTPEGREASMAYFGEGGEPILDTQAGIHAVHWKYDTAGNQNEQRYVDLNGKLVVSGWGYAGWRKVFDMMGRETEKHHFDLNDNKPAAATYIGPSVEVIRQQYNQRSQLARRWYEREDGRPSENKEGIHSVDFADLDSGNPKPHCFDAKGKSLACVCNEDDCDRVGKR